ncbi:MAG TPA: PSD1 and planctomycete cytochrome C domain-containing protein [Verrucomicrobiales bacterium]|nr:PSD1 and planctomycete cytochrome C domain-containing protein [Verrucomicrobiales bacterium]
MHTLFQIRCPSLLRSGWLALALALAPGLAGLLIAGVEESGAVDFEKDVQPILSANCFRCHDSKERKGGLHLDQPAGIAQGGDSGEPVLIPGNAEESHLVRLISGLDPSLTMPPKGERLATEEIALIRAWIDQGAALPRGEPGRDAEESAGTDHWSLQPLAAVEPPPVAHDFVRNGVDAFIWAGLEGEGLRPSPAADRRKLIRRVYQVMQGLPPSPQETAAFEADSRPDAYEALVERVLGSPRYGERWARHWLDVARYADSNGFETNRLRPTAYHYRDWVIRSLNDDKPYERFVREQLAGDRLEADPATGFLVAGAYDIVKSPDPALTLMQRQDELADMVNTTGTAFLGLTVGCARCHNHKFDPIPQKDYYAMQAVFAGVSHGERPLGEAAAASRRGELAAAREDLRERESELDGLRALAAAARGGEDLAGLRPPVQPGLNIEEFGPAEAKAIRFVIVRTNSSAPCLDELEILDESGKNVGLASEGGRPSASGSLSGYPIHKLEHLNDGRFGNSWSWISDTVGRGWAQIDLPRVFRVAGLRWGRDREGAFSDRIAVDYRVEAQGPDGAWKTVASSEDRAPYGGPESSEAFLKRLKPGDAARARELLAETARLRSKLETLGEGAAGWLGSFAQPEPTRRLYRGDPFEEREVVDPGALSVIGSSGLPAGASEAERRIWLGKWIVEAAHPLTARVMANRIWQHHFGAGIVDTSSDLGVNGGRPSHPELLDWLAGELIRGEWSLKRIHRLILLSSTFRQDSAPNVEAASRDADSRLLWRYPPRRLAAEAIRDSILQVSGALDLKMGGPGFYLLDIVEENVMHYFPKEETGPEEWRRMIYMNRVRQEQDAVFGSFDCPDGNQVMPQRNRSTTPLQALNLFNSRFVMAQSDLLAERLRREWGNQAADQVAGAFRLFYGREPTPAEAEDSEALAREEGLEAFCRALFNTSEFLFIF